MAKQSKMFNFDESGNVVESGGVYSGKKIVLFGSDEIYLEKNGQTIAMTNPSLSADGALAHWSKRAGGALHGSGRSEPDATRAKIFSFLMAQEYQQVAG